MHTHDDHSCHVGSFLPPNYPFLNPSHDHDRGHGCCPPLHHDHDAPLYHAGGFMNVNAFMLVGGQPFIRDNVCDKYARRLCVSEHVHTTVSQKRDPSCINLSAKFDMTDSINTNTTLTHFLTKTIENTHSKLGGVLPILKSDVCFILFYSVTDECGDIVFENTHKVFCHELNFHPTDVADYFITSADNVLITNLPAMNYRGKYTLILDKIVAVANVVNTKQHLEEGDLNPFYQFTKNNTRIAVQHDTINEQEADAAVVIAACMINHPIPFQANVTTRLRIGFTAYMSNMIASANTFEIWTALTDSNTERIEALEDEVMQLTQELAALREAIYTQQDLDALLDRKVDKILGKGLSTNDYTDADKEKVDNIPESVNWEVLS